MSIELSLEGWSRIAQGGIEVKAREKDSGGMKVVRVLPSGKSLPQKLCET